ncbi:MAG: hypothetical protein AB7L66_04610 [Gemmatimonadales bacterium]
MTGGPNRGTRPVSAAGGSRRGAAFAVATALSLLVWVVLSVANAPLRTAAAPAGIISFELAGTAARATEIVAGWGPPQREAAAFGLGLDFLFLFLYPVAISLGARLVADRLAPRFPRLALTGIGLSLALPLCVALDAAENAALWRILQLGATDGLARFAMVAATVKFSLVALGLAYTLGGWFVARFAARSRAA